MKKLLYIYIIFHSFIALSQKDKYRDYQWSIGGRYEFDGVWGTRIDFHNDTKMWAESNVKPLSTLTGTSICNKYGDLVIFTNGCALYDEDFNKIEYSDSLSLGFESNKYGSCAKNNDLNNSSNQNGVLILPHPKNENQYFVFNKPSDVYSTKPLNPNSSLKDSLFLSKQYLYATLVDMSLNNGKGKVIYKHKVIYKDTFNDGQIMAVRHGNGHDWWITTTSFQNNDYYHVLLDTAGNFTTQVQKEPIHRPKDREKGSSGQVCFSPKGDHYARYRCGSGLDVYDFDRTKGELSNYRFVTFPEDSVRLDVGTAFSPNNRFLYVSFPYCIYQIDMQASDLQASVIKVATYDGFKSIVHNPGWATYFYQAQLAPDCRIYISCRSTVYYMHVIEEPNKKGTACHVIQHFETPSKIDWSLPIFPNFRLGAIGTNYAVCDSTKELILGINDPVPTLVDAVVFPNPASQDFTLMLDEAPIFKAGSMHLYNTSGQEIANYTLQNGENSYHFELPQSLSGLYIYHIVLDGKVAAIGKMTVVQ